MNLHPHRLSSETALGFNPVFLTLCTHDRQKFFTNPVIVELVLTQILRACESESFALPAYCFMPDHFHAVVVGDAETSDLHRLMKHSKQLTAFHARRVFGLKLWQTSFFDRSLRSDESLKSVAKYIINNPVRAGLVERVEDYPYWGSGNCTRDDLLDFVATLPST